MARAPAAHATAKAQPTSNGAALALAWRETKRITFTLKVVGVGPLPHICQCTGVILGARQRGETFLQPFVKRRQLHGRKLPIAWIARRSAAGYGGTAADACRHQTALSINALLVTTTAALAASLASLAVISGCGT